MHNLCPSSWKILIMSEEDISMGLLAGTTRLETGSQGFHVTEGQVTKNITSCHDAEKLSLLEPMFERLSDGRWFSRAWCNQEYMLNENHTFILVGRMCPFIALDSILGELLSQMNQIGACTGNLETHPTFCQFSFGVGASTPQDLNLGSVFWLFCDTEQLLCTLYGRHCIHSSQHKWHRSSLHRRCYRSR